jgi:hypothetical protein
MANCGGSRLVSHSTMWKTCTRPGSAARKTLTCNTNNFTGILKICTKSISNQKQNLRVKIFYFTRNYFAFDKFVEEVNVLLAPALDGSVEAADEVEVGGVGAGDAKTVVAPVAGVVADREVVLRVAGVVAVHHLRVELAEDDREVCAAPLDRVQPDPLQRRHREHNVHVHEEQYRVLVVALKHI